MENITNNKELSCLMSSALTDADFRDLLLTDPAIALEKGDNGQAFLLTPEEKELVTSIRANSLTDFARQLLEKHNGSSRNFIIKDKQRGEY